MAVFATVALAIEPKPSVGAFLAFNAALGQCFGTDEPLVTINGDPVTRDGQVDGKAQRGQQREQSRITNRLEAGTDHDQRGYRRISEPWPHGRGGYLERR